MGTIKRTVGFTIIETMMFLAITGLLAVGILAGTGAAIAQQRYKDSVNSLQSFVQDQFSKVVNVANSRDGTWRCDAGVAVQKNGESRGTGDCVILGRLIRVDESGTQLTANDVLGQRKPAAQTQASDLAELTTNYDIAVSPIDADTEEVAWGAMIVQPHSAAATPQPTTILIIRSPLSGKTLAFASPSVVSPGALISGGVTASPTLLCVEPADGAIGRQRLGVRLSAYAASQSAVQVAPESEHVCE